MVKPEMIAYIQQLIELSLHTFEKIYLHCVVSDKLKVGNRPFKDSELTHGIFFLISARSCRKFTMEENYIYAELRFSGVWENVYIPYRSIISILDNIEKPSSIVNLIHIDQADTDSDDIQNNTNSDADSGNINENDKIQNIKNLKSSKPRTASKQTGKSSSKDVKNKIIKPDFNKKK